MEGLALCLVAIVHVQWAGLEDDVKQVNLINGYRLFF